MNISSRIREFIIEKQKEKIIIIIIIAKATTANAVGRGDDERKMDEKKRNAKTTLFKCGCLKRHSESKKLNKQIQ